MEKKVHEIEHLEQESSTCDSCDDWICYTEHHSDMQVTQ